MWKFFENLVSAFPDNECDEKRPPQTFFGFLYFYSRGMGKLLFLISCLSALVGVGEALFFWYIGHFVDVLAVSSPDTVFKEHQTSFVTFGVLALVVLPILQTVHHLVLNQAIRSNFPMQVRYRMHRRLLRQSLDFFSTEFSGRLSQKLMQTSMGIRDTVLKCIDVIVNMIVYFITMVGMLASADMSLMGVLLVWLIAYILIMYHFLPLLRRASKAAAEKRSDMVGRIVDSYTNIQTVKLFSRNSHEEHYALESMHGCLKAEYILMRLVTRFDLSVQYIDYLLIAMLTGLAIWLWSTGTILVGAIAVALTLAIRVNNMSQWVMWEVGLIFDNIGNVQNGMDTMSKPLSIKDPENPIELPKITGEINFNNITFGYDPAKPIFQDFNLHIKKGERIGIVGHSGSGKSTLVNLLLRFYDVQKGSIEIDGHDIRSFRQDDLRASMAMVSQDISLLHRSVRANILYGTEMSENTENAMRQAARKAEADSFIETLSDGLGHRGYDTEVGERGVRLSGGQRQRIAIARIIIKDSPILILDEATSALDSEIEAAVQENLEKMMADKTVIAIAHRLSTIAAMDRLIVLDHGMIAESGTHSELLAKNGIYAMLWNKQTGGFLWHEQ